MEGKGNVVEQRKKTSKVNEKETKGSSALRNLRNRNLGSFRHSKDSLSFPFCFMVDGWI